jgi:hypothetical protein
MGQRETKCRVRDTKIMVPGQTALRLAIATQESLRKGQTLRASGRAKGKAKAVRKKVLSSTAWADVAL